MSFFNTFKKNPRVDFLIVGVQKCGTTSLHEFLKDHSILQSPSNKELYFFSNNYNYTTLGVDWYHAQWKKFGKKNKLYFESTPDYFSFPFCVERIARYNQDMKFLLMVRDPIKRAYSQYNMLWQINADAQEKESTINRYFVNMNPEIEYLFTRLFLNPKGFPSFEELVQDEIDFLQKKTDRCASGLLRMGFYLEQLESYYKYFPKGRFAIFENKELENEPGKVLNEICSFLNVKPIKWNIAAISKKHNKRNYYNPVNESLNKTLSALFKPHNEAFFKHIGKRYEWS